MSRSLGPLRYQATPDQIAAVAALDSLTDRAAEIVVDAGAVDAVTEDPCEVCPPERPLTGTVVFVHRGDGSELCLGHAVEMLSRNLRVRDQVSPDVFRDGRRERVSTPPSALVFGEPVTVEPPSSLTAVDPHRMDFLMLPGSPDVGGVHLVDGHCFVVDEPTVRRPTPQEARRRAAALLAAAEWVESRVGTIPAAMDATEEDTS